jgi:hypothetical protein
VNFLQLAQRLHSETLRSTAAPTSVTGASERHARLFNRISDAWRDLQGERDWKWMRGTTDAALTVGQQIYTGAELGAVNFGRWRPEDSTYSVQLYLDGSPNTLWYASEWNLDSMRNQWVYRNTTVSSTPVNWASDEEQRMVLGPKPALSYKIRAEYWKEPTELVADDDAPDLPERFHMVLVWAGLKGLALDDAAPETRAKAEENYAKLHGALLRDQSRMPHL